MPQTLQPLQPYLSLELPACLDQPEMRGSIALLPGLGEVYGKNLPCVPLPHGTEDEYPYTHVVPPDKMETVI